MRPVLDAEAVVALLEREHDARARVVWHLAAARRLRKEVGVAAVTLAELYRGVGRTRSLDAFLNREGELLHVRDTDRALARLVGAVLHEAARGSEDLVDAHAVALTVEAGGGTILTGDPHDLERLSAPYPTVTVVALS